MYAPPAGARVITLRVRQGEAAQELGEIPVRAGIKHQVPMVRHQAVSQNAHGHELQAFFHESEKILIMRLDSEQAGTKIGPVPSVVNHSPHIHSPHATHDQILPHLSQEEKGT
jgi:hypothetical protein